MTTRQVTYPDAFINGVWRDKPQAEGTFVEEPAPSGNLHHPTGAIAALKAMDIDMTPQVPAHTGRPGEAR